MKPYTFLLFLVFGFTQSLSCEDILSLSNTEDEVIQKVHENFDVLSKNLNCIDVMLKGGFQRPLERYLELLSRNNIKFYPHLKKSILSIRETLDKFQNQFKYNDTEYAIVSPAIQWAQSLDNIYLLIKLSHRHDAPGCLELIDEDIRLSPSHFLLTATCKQSDYPMKFLLDLQLFDLVDDLKSTSERSSVGRVNIVLRKNRSGYWKSLVKQGVPLPPNIKVWYDMRKKFEDELSYYYEQEEEEEARREEEELKAIRNRKRQNKQNISEQTENSKGESDNKREDL